MSPKTKKLFLEQVTDTYIRENFRRIEFLLDRFESAGIGSPGPTGPQGPQGDPGLTQATSTGGSSGGTTTGGSVDITQNRAVKFTILAFNVAEDVTKYQEVVVLNTDDTTANLKVISGFSGGNAISYTIVPQINAGIIELLITNNESYDLQIEVTQVLLGNF